MATPKVNLSLNELELLAFKYIDECMNSKKEHPTTSGKIVLLNDRRIPTIDYFLKIWIPLQNKPTLCRSTYYRWLNDELNQNKCYTVTLIQKVFDALTIDIVANDNKGIFYAKNKLGWNDKTVTEINGKFNIPPLPDIGNRQNK